MNQRLPIRRGSQLVLTIFAIFIVPMVVVSVLFYPLAFSGLESLMRDTGNPSNVGQAYAALSSLVSSLALIGVAVSLLFQARAGRTAREQSIRNLQQQLIMMEMEDPALMTAVGAPWGLPIPAESAKIRDYLYVHMWATFWAGNYVVGELSAPAARKMARAELLSSQAGRAYWAAVRNNVLSTNEGKYRQFARIVDQEYWEVIANKVPVNAPVKVTENSGEPAIRPWAGLQNTALVGIALAAGLLVGRKLTQIRAGR